MALDTRKQPMVYKHCSKDTHFRCKIKWRLEHLGALRIMGEIALYGTVKWYMTPHIRASEIFYWILHNINKLLSLSVTSDQLYKLWCPCWCKDIAVKVGKPEVTFCHRNRSFAYVDIGVLEIVLFPFCSFAFKIPRNASLKVQYLKLKSSSNSNPLRLLLGDSDWSPVWRPQVPWTSSVRCGFYLACRSCALIWIVMSFKSHSDMVNHQLFGLWSTSKRFSIFLCFTCVHVMTCVITYASLMRHWILLRKRYGRNPITAGVFDLNSEFWKKYTNYSFQKALYGWRSFEPLVPPSFMTNIYKKRTLSDNKSLSH